jgi:multidrug efflux pump subunit AcrA (membrane-fusion protein)
VLDGSRDLVLGAVVATRFPRAVGPTDSFIVPVAALDERGAGARVWRVADRRVEPVAVDVLGMDDSFAHVQGPLLPGDTIVALGTHLLNAGMAVRTLPR